ncbi:TRAP transporter substrate-binding protein [Marinobacterium iners]|uniref:TRAP-type C4-dicarboxylate transport system, substrate-binding protein n=1 Tax=Marinobacterium iners DSM 11526 TaxID=1122198 RepID=A0A1H4GZT6_9GAMM|nr:TRAP transporter substrate-binding protein [Marinobacterium iners]SEB14996.1 TRAP-type C4-dicarboxylate transport system, substrate-binding protein [Marinobacterium iners DSM 11526]
MRIKTLATAVTFSLVGLTLSSHSYSADAEYTFKLHHMLPPMAMPHAEFLEPWAEKIEQESGGRIDIEIYPAMQLGGKPPQLFDQARKGIVDMTWTVGGYTPGRFPKAKVFELPFMPASAKATSMALQAYAESEMSDELADVHLLAMHTHAPGSLHSREKSIQTSADLERTNFRSPNKVMADAFSPYGTNSIFMPVTQMPSAVSKGVLDIAVLPYEVVASMKIHQLVKHHTEIPGERGLYTQFFVFAMNKDAYASLPPDLQEVIDNNSGIELAGHIGSLFDKHERLAKQQAVEQGNSFHVLSEQERDHWVNTMTPVHDVWIKDMTERGYPGEHLYKRAKALIQQYAEQVNGES